MVVRVVFEVSWAEMSEETHPAMAGHTRGLRVEQMIRAIRFVAILKLLGREKLKYWFR